MTTLIDYTLLDNVLFLTRIRKKPNDVAMYKKAVIEALGKLGPRINGTLNEENNFINLYPKAINYAIQVGDSEPLKIWIDANNQYLKMVSMKTQHNRNMLKIVKEGARRINNLEEEILSKEISQEEEPVALIGGNGRGEKVSP